MKTKALLLVTLVILTSCGTMRLYLKAPYKNANGTGVITYERAYPVGGAMPLWCGLSAIFYGGACWAYLAMPFVPQQDKFVSDATAELNAKTNSTDSIIENPEVLRISWSSAVPYIAVEPTAQ
ncbi:MAG: hypothetical protein V4598_00225 [Bdellovibrionota bacterium]